MIKSKKQYFNCVEAKELTFGTVEAGKKYNAVRESEGEYRISTDDGKIEFHANRDELLSCGYLS